MMSLCKCSILEAVQFASTVREAFQLMQMQMHA